MSFYEVQFPPGISYGSIGGPGHNTAIVEVDAGTEDRIARWADARRSYDAQFGVKTPTQMSEVLEFVVAMQGATHGFRWKDWSDFTTGIDHIGAPSAVDEVIGAGDGVTIYFQLISTYTRAPAPTRTRRIEKPTVNVLVALDGVTKTLGTDYTVNPTNGVVQFTPAPGSGVIVSAGCEFDVPVRFGKELDELLAIRFDGAEIRAAESIPIVELKNETAVDDEWMPRGARTVNPFNADVGIAGNDPYLISFNPNSSARIVTLPNPAALSPGGPWFVLMNLHASNTITVKDHVAATVGTIAALGAMTIVIGIDAASTKKWYAF